jgi:hypothetical protein
MLSAEMSIRVLDTLEFQRFPSSFHIRKSGRCWQWYDRILSDEAQAL